MPTKPLAPAVTRRILELKAAGKSNREIRDLTGVSVGTVSNVTTGKLPDPGGHPTAAERQFVETEDAATVSLHTDKPIKTLEDALRAAQVDPAVWYVDRWEVSDWTVPMKVEQGQAVKALNGGEALAWQAAKPIQTQQYRVKVYLKRILPRTIQQAVADVFATWKHDAPRWPKLPGPSRVKGDTYMALMGLFDVHFGKLCWRNETGEDYDLKIAEAVFRNAVEDLIAESRHRHVSKILLPVGNDWLHVDTRTHTTTRGTPQDVDGRFSKVLATGIRAAVWAVEAMASVAPVQVELVPGNHDRTLAECLCHVLDARFHHTDRVTVGTEPKTRKYVRYGTTLLGLTHGDLVKPETLPMLMPAEAPKEWAETRCHEWITGHGHRELKWTTKDTHSTAGTKVRMLRPLTRTDLYHFDHGYVGEMPGAEVLFYGFERGYAGHSVVYARGG